MVCTTTLLPPPQQHAPTPPPPTASACSRPITALTQAVPWITRRPASAGIPHARRAPDSTARLPPAVAAPHPNVPTRAARRRTPTTAPVAPTCATKSMECTVSLQKTSAKLSARNQTVPSRTPRRVSVARVSAMPVPVCFARPRPTRALAERLAPTLMEMLQTRLTAHAEHRLATATTACFATFPTMRAKRHPTHHG
jgi:hypothetical protein